MKRYDLGSTNEVPADYEGEQFFTVADLVANGDAECPGYHTGSHELVATVDGRFVECQGCLTYYATT